MRSDETLLREAARRVLPPKASDRPGGRRVVFLDQNVLSALAKRRLGRLSGGAEAATEALASALKIAVHERQTALVVETVHHRLESEPLDTGRTRGRQLHNEIWQELKLLSSNFRFEEREDIIGYQLCASILAARGHVMQPLARWNKVATRYPDERREEPFVISAPWQTKFGPLPAGWATRQDDERRAGKLGDREIVFARLLEESRHLAERRAHAWTYRDDPDPTWRIGLDDVVAFIKSEAYAHLPFVHVEASLFAAILCERNRRFMDSDQWDIENLAAAIPYCDLVLADTYMAEKTRQLRLDALYQTLVLPAGLDAYEQAATWLLNLELPPGSPWDRFAEE